MWHLLVCCDTSSTLFFCNIAHIYIQVKGQLKGVVKFAYVQFPGYKKISLYEESWDFNSELRANILWKLQSDSCLLLWYFPCWSTTNTWEICFSCQKINHSVNKWLKLTLSFYITKIINLILKSLIISSVYNIDYRQVSRMS